MLSRADQTDLLLPLAEGLLETPPFATFVQRLRRRLRGGYGLLAAALPDGITTIGEDFDVATPRGEAALLRDLLLSDPRRVAALRPGRIYDGTELRPDHPEPEARRTLARWRDIRLVRVASGGEGGTLLLLADTSATFGAGDTGMLAGLLPHLDAALRTQALLDGARARAAIAAGALATSGVGWITLNAMGEIADLSALAAGLLARPDRPAPAIGQRLVATSPAARRLLGEAVARFAGKEASSPAIVRLSDDPPQTLLLLPLPDGGAGRGPVALALLRLPHARRGSSARATLIADEFALTAGEARIADALARGHSLAESAALGGVTLETARFYTKRAYEKTGTHGQGGLVATVLAGVSALGVQ